MLVETVRNKLSCRDASPLALGVLCMACGATPATPPPPRPSETILASREPQPIAPAASASAAVEPPDVVLHESSDGAFVGAQGNLSDGITGVWGVGQRVVLAGTDFVYRSNDHGLTFQRAAVSTRFPVVWGPSADELYVGGETGVLHSIDGGATFQRCAAPGGVVQSIWGRSADEVYAVGGQPGFLARSTDHCASWQQLATPATRSGWFYDVTSTGSDLVLVGTDSESKRGGVAARSTDGGQTWKALARLGEARLGEGSRKICFADGTLFASTAYALYASTDLGKHWKLATQVGTEVLSLACRRRDVIVGGRNRMLFVSRDQGATWTRDALEHVFTGSQMVSAQAAYITETGTAFVGFDSDGHGGTLVRRAH